MRPWQINSPLGGIVSGFCGLPTVIVLFILLTVSGIIPSVLSNQHQEVLLVVKQIRTISASVAGMRYAECVNQADVVSQDNAQKFQRMMRRCRTSYDQLRQALEDLGGEAAGTADFEMEEKPLQ